MEESVNKIDPTGYVVVDDFFGAPYVDVDEWLKSAAPHRSVLGGFSGTDTRFAFRFPPDELYQGRRYQPLEGATPATRTLLRGHSARSRAARRRYFSSAATSWSR